MSIRKDSSWDKNSGKFVGCVDFGGLMEESDKTATEALVFMAVGLSGRWKMPVAYFFTDHASSEIQTNLILDCIQRLYAANNTVRAVTCNGTEVNLSMFRRLGATVW